jgi:integrase
MGLYLRGNVWWMRYKNALGEWDDESTGFPRAKERDAKRVLDATTNAIAARAPYAESELGPLTIRRFVKTWLADRKARGLESAVDDAARLENHILPVLGDVVLSELRPRQVQDFIRSLRTKLADRKQTPLAPRTVRHCFTLLRTMMTDAMADELVDRNPCVLKKGDLPKKRDNDPLWRAKAIFTRAEAETLIADERVPLDRRVWHALHFLTGLRPGEGCALRWRDYDPASKPLGRFTISKAMDRKRTRVKGTKTEIPRDIPVHPTLKGILEGWREEGWKSVYGRAPTLDDLIVPSREMKPRGNRLGLRRFHEDLERLGLDKRRFYDARRTFISLALGDGARKDILRWVTHPAYDDQMDEYTSISWAARCEAMACLRIELRPTPCPAIPDAPEASVGDDRANDEADLGDKSGQTTARKPASRLERLPEFAAVLAAVEMRQEKTPKSCGLGGQKVAGCTGLEPVASGVTGRRYNQLN